MVTQPRQKQGKSEAECGLAALFNRTTSDSFIILFCGKEMFVKAFSSRQEVE
jgi:hypothetical protein